MFNACGNYEDIVNCIQIYFMIHLPPSFGFSALLTICSDLAYIFQDALCWWIYRAQFCNWYEQLCFSQHIFGCTPPDIRAEIVWQYSDVKAPLCIIFATSSFGMGVDCSGIHQVIHNGVTRTWRAGHDGKSALALPLHESNKEFLEYHIW